MSTPRLDGRAPGAIRPMRFTRHWLPSVPGSVLVECGRTRVLCTAIVEDGVPGFLKDSPEGWVTAEYAMLPGSTGNRRQRERGIRQDGRSIEIQRLIGRALRCVVDRKALKGRTAWVDCDVLSADGGTRTASINAAYVALHDAFTAAKENGGLKRWPLIDSLQAVSVGLVEGEGLVDLSYYEDSSAEVDMNLIMTGSEKIIEVNGGAEQQPFELTQFEELVELGRAGRRQVDAAQQAALKS